MPFDILLGGHSHLNALAGDRHVEAPSLRSLENDPTVAILDGPWPRPDAYWQSFAAEASDRIVGLIWGGNEHNSAYFFQAACEFDFTSRYVPYLLGRSQIITQRTVRQRFRNLTLKDLETTLKAVSAAGPRKLGLIGTPPPKKDSEKLRAMLAREPHFLAWAEALKTPIETIGITDPFVRLKLWYLLQDMLRELATKFDFDFLATPPEAQDAEGFLKEEFWAPDITHANADYGRLMLAKVLRELRA